MISLLSQLFRYFKAHRKFWMAPVVALLLVLGFFITVTETSTIAPFIYALF